MFSRQAVSKSELATLVGVSLRTFASWLRGCQSGLVLSACETGQGEITSEGVRFVARFVMIDYKFLQLSTKD